MPPPPPPPPPHRPPTTPSSSATAPTHRHSPPINFLRAPSDIHPAPPHSLRAACSPHQEQPSTVHTLAHAHYKLWPWCPGTAAATAATSAAFSYLHKSLLSSSYSSASSSTSSTPVTALLPLLAQLARFLFSIEVAGLYPRLTVSRFLFCVRAFLTRLYLFFSFLRFQNLHSIYIGSFFSSSNLAFVPCHVCAFLFDSTRLMVLLFIGSFRFSYLSFLFRYLFSLSFLKSTVFLFIDFSSFFYRYLFVILSHFLSTYFHLYYSNISLLLSNFFIPFPFLPLISVFVSSIPISFLYHVLSLSVFPSLLLFLSLFLLVAYTFLFLTLAHLIFSIVFV